MVANHVAIWHLDLDGGGHLDASSDLLQEVRVAVDEEHPRRGGNDEDCEALDDGREGNSDTLCDEDSAKGEEPEGHHD